MKQEPQQQDMRSRIIAILRLLGGGTLFALAIGSVFFIASTSDSARAGREVDYYRYLVSNLKNVSSLIIYTPMVFAMARSSFVSSAKPLMRVCLWIGIVVLTGLFMFAYMMATSELLYDIAPSKMLAEQRLIFWTPDLFVVVGLIVFGHMSAVSRRQREAEQNAAKLAKAVAEQKAELEAHETKYLRGRLGNHFVMNGLSNLLGLIRLGRYDDAENATIQLGDILRSISSEPGEHESRNMVPLSRELELAEKYLAFQEVRFPSLKSHFDIDDSLQDVLVPRQILQPIIENAFKHNDLPPEPEVSVRATPIGTDTMLIQVDSSNMAPVADVAGIGEGLRLTDMRLKSVYGDAASVRRSYERNVYRVTLGLPIPEDDSENDEEEVLLTALNEDETKMGTDGGSA